MGSKVRQLNTHRKSRGMTEVSGGQSYFKKSEIVATSLYKGHHRPSVR
jgi:hypothetical protein